MQDVCILLLVNNRIPLAQVYNARITRPFYFLKRVGYIRLVVISHLPRQLSQILPSFILRNGTIDCCIVTGERCSMYLPKGDLKIFASYFQS